MWPITLICCLDLGYNCLLQSSVKGRRARHLFSVDLLSEIGLNHIINWAALRTSLNFFYVTGAVGQQTRTRCEYQKVFCEAHQIRRTQQWTTHQQVIGFSAERLWLCSVLPRGGCRWTWCAPASWSSGPLWCPQTLPPPRTRRQHNIASAC